MHVLSIGNSFSQDAQRYLASIARSEKFDLTTFNLYIGGCSLDKHYRNMLSGKDAYTLEMDGKSTWFNVSLDEALLNRKWDVITIQQVSESAPDYETYQPYLDRLADYIRESCPSAKIAIHQTWAYEEGCKRLTEELGYKNQKEMYKDIKNAYEKAADVINADFILNSGEAFQELIEHGVGPVHRDGYHASFGVGRFTLGLLWYKMLSQKSVKNVTFNDFDEEIPKDVYEKIKDIVENM